MNIKYYSRKLVVTIVFVCRVSDVFGFSTWSCASQRVYLHAGGGERNSHNGDHTHHTLATTLENRKPESITLNYLSKPVSRRYRGTHGGFTRVVEALQFFATFLKQKLHTSSIDRLSVAFDNCDTLDSQSKCGHTFT
jgi:hypothetical protein